MANRKISQEVATGTVITAFDPANPTYLMAHRVGLTDDQGALALDHVDTLLAYASKLLSAMAVNADADPGASLHYKVDAPFYEFIPASPLSWATKEELWARSGDTSAAISTSVLFDSQVPTAVTYAATLAIDLDTGQNFSVAVTGNLVLDIPTNLRAGKEGLITLTYNGAHTTAWDADSNIIGGEDIVFPSGNGSRITMGYRCISGTQIEVGTFVSLDT